MIKHFNGVNLQPSYYHGGDVDLGWALMKNYPNIKAVRIEIEPGKETLARRWIQEAKENGYGVVATYHKFKALLSDDPAELLAAGQWWADNYHSLGEGFTVNLMNEWGSHHIDPAALASAFNNAIVLVRQVYHGPIILDCPGGGSGTAAMAAAVIGTQGIKIEDDNIILSAHIYPNGYNGQKKQFLRPEDLNELEACGRPCMIGEFGNMPDTGRASWSDIVDYARVKGWPLFAWAWNGDGGPGLMNMIKPQFQSLTAQPADYYISDYFRVVYSKL